jgi:hypothetical protein
MLKSRFMKERRIMKWKKGVNCVRKRKAEKMKRKYDIQRNIY